MLVAAVGALRCCCALAPVTLDTHCLLTPPLIFAELPAKMLAMAKFDSPDMEDLGPIRSFFKF